MEASALIVRRGEGRGARNKEAWEYQKKGKIAQDWWNCLWEKEIVLSSPST